MKNTSFNPDRIQLKRGNDSISQYVSEKFDLLEKDVNTRIERAFLDVIGKVLGQLEFMVVVDGQLTNLQKEREIVLKLATFHIIFSVLERKVGTGINFAEACKFTGTLVGREYAKTIINIILSDNVLLDYQGFLNLWCRFDTRAAWGHFMHPEFLITEKIVKLEIHNAISALREPLATPDIMNEFVKGYVYGVVDEGFRALDFLFRQCDMFKLPHPSFSVNSIKIDFRHPHIYTTILLEEPTFRDAYDEFFKYCYLPRWEDLSTLRRSIEFALKEIFGIEKSSYYSTQRLLKALVREQLNQIDFKMAHELYQKFSDFTHRGTSIDEVQINELFFQTRYFLAELALHNMPRETIKRLKRNIEVEQPSPNMIQELEGEVQKTVKKIDEPELEHDDQSKLIWHYSRTIQQLETIITYYEKHRLDVLEIEAKRGGEMFVDPIQRSQKQEYEQKILEFTESRKLMEQRLNQIKNKEKIT